MSLLKYGLRGKVDIEAQCLDRKKKDKARGWMWEEATSQVTYLRRVL